MRPRKMTAGFLDAFAEAFNPRDMEATLAAMTDDCVFEASAGPVVCGRRYEGPREVGKAFAEVFETFSDAHWQRGYCGSRVNVSRGFERGKPPRR